MAKNIKRIFAILMLSPSILMSLPGDLFARDAPIGVRVDWKIPEGELLKYDLYEGGIINREIRIVSTLDSSKREAKIYLDDRALDSDRPVPKSYRDYPSYFIVNLENASIVRYHEDNYEYKVKEKHRQGIFYWDISFDGTELVKRSKSLDRDGIHDRQYTIRDLDTGYPIWNMEALLMFGLRILDWEHGGALLTVVSEDRSVWKSRLVILGTELVQTPAGDFKTTKLQWRASSFFLDILMRIFFDPLYIWVENGPSHRIIKTSYGKQMTLLTATGVAK